MTHPALKDFQDWRGGPGVRFEAWSTRDGQFAVKNGMTGRVFPCTFAKLETALAWAQAKADDAAADAVKARRVSKAALRKARAGKAGGQ